MKIFTKTYEISDDTFNFLVSLQNSRYAEYRDTEYKTLSEFREDPRNNNRNDDYFLLRNANGTYEIASEMYALGFVEDVEDSWHITYKLSHLGKEAVEQLTSTQYVRNDKLNKLIT